MTKPLSLLWALPLVAGLAAAPAFAQDTTTDDTATEDTTAADTTTEGTATGTSDDTTPQPPADSAAGSGSTNIGGDLTLGETEGTAPAQPAAPETYIKTSHGDWQLQCLRVPEGTDAEDPCQMYQLLKDGNGGNVAEVSLFRLENGGQVAAGGTFVVPLETLLTQKLSVAVDGAQAKRYDFSFCTQVGCYARVGFTADEIAQFKAGNTAKITIAPALAPDQKVELTMSLAGFTAAIEETSQLRQ
ncbi:invasion protein [Salipiger aestuarii]|uniref:Invasion protein IalB n=1 Tax=Salipiger aestuarii TaxID=568098 RepID=A0A327XNR9_9RHOB|nr:invasion associated locus B family protein [Salipiger aestuarii]KAA8605591.1 invasion protein [Salipiger aestuarii]KAA8608165.1 invasion protein [Salipiger aestuarii]KAB2539370.1 invasion protein [Salipiger aestuarii]RAK10470.1 invasion protein IalB [Salipiger aestuarii]